MRHRILASLVASLSLALALGGSASAVVDSQPPPGNVANFRSISITQTSIATAWDAASRASTYRLSRNGSVVASTSALSYTFSGLTCGTTYTLSVAAVNKSGVVGSTSSISRTTASCITPPPPPPAPDTAITSVACGTVAPDGNCVDGNADGGNTVTVSYTVTNGDGANCKLDSDAYVNCGPSPSTVLWGSASCTPHTVYVQGKRSSDGAVDTSPATASVTIEPAAGCAPPPPPPDATTCGDSNTSDTVTIAPCSAGAFFIRSMESPEVLPTQSSNGNFFCCGAYFDILGADTYYDPTNGTRGSLDPDPTNSANHVFHAHVEDSTAYADFSQIDMGQDDGHDVAGTDTWSTFKVYFPSTFKPTGYSSGQINSRFNWFHEPIHEGNNQPCTGFGYDSGNDAIGVYNVQPGYTWNGRDIGGERFVFQAFGGQQVLNSNCGPNSFQDFSTMLLQRSHWYTFTEHMHWSATGTTGNTDGLWEVWIDGQKQLTAVTPNLYRHPDGSIEQGYPFIGFYRGSLSTTSVPTTWPDDVYFDDYKNGPTAASIGVTP